MNSVFDVAPHGKMAFCEQSRATLSAKAGKVARSNSTNKAPMKAPTSMPWTNFGVVAISLLE